MGKMIYLISAVIAVQLALWLAFGVYTPGSTLLELFLNPQANWDTLGLSRIFTDALFAVAAGSMVIGTFFFKSDFMVLAGAASIIYTFGIGLANAWQQVCAHINPLVTSSTQITCSGGLSPVIASILVSPIILLYIFTLVEWWGGRD